MFGFPCQPRAGLLERILSETKWIFVQRWTKRWALGCEKFQPDPDWLLLSKTGPSFSQSLFNFASFYACQSRRARCEH